MGKILRPYQADAVEGIFREWETHRSVMLVLATGTGKTATASAVVERRLDAGKVLWLAHRTELIEQARDALQEAVGADVRIGIEKAESRARLSCMYGQDDRIVVASVQTMRDKRLARFDPSDFATVVIDECHHATAKTYRDIIGAFGSSKVLGLTATPDRGDGIGMDNAFDAVAYEYSMLDGMRDGYLCPLRALAVDVEGLDLSKVRTTAGELNEGDLRRILEVDEVHHRIASPLVDLSKDRPTIIFCVTVEQSKALADVLQGYLSDGKQVRHIDGSTPAETRKRILAEYSAGDVQYITNVGVLTEGFDAPRTSCIALARPTKSRALYAQMVGRGTRLFPGKEDCLLVDFRGNAGRHSLANPVDLLAGKDLSDDVRAIAEKMMSDGKVLDRDAMAEAEAEHVKRLAEADRKRAAAAALRIAATVRAEALDLFRIALEPDRALGHREATIGQRTTLENFGMEPEKVARLTFDQASRQIDKLMSRRKRGLCTYKQARTLAKHGFGPDKSFDSARQIMDYLAANGWRIPPHVRPSLEALP